MHIQGERQKCFCVGLMMGSSFRLENVQYTTDSLNFHGILLSAQLLLFGHDDTWVNHLTFPKWSHCVCLWKTHWTPLEGVQRSHLAAPFVPPLLPPSAPRPENLLFRHRLNNYPFMQLLPWGQPSQHASSLCARPLTGRRWDALYTNPSGLILAVKSGGLFFKWQLAACRQNRGAMLATETMASPWNLLCSNHGTTNQTCLCLPL